MISFSAYTCSGHCMADALVMRFMANWRVVVSSADKSRMVGRAVGKV